MKCPNSQCKHNVVQKSEAGVKIRLKGPIEIDGAGIAHSKCYWCGTAVELPLELRKSFVEERFFLNPAGTA